VPWHIGRGAQEGSKRIRFPFSPGREKGLGDEGENVKEQIDTA